MSFEKLYMLEIVKDTGSVRQPVAYSHDIKKLRGLAFTKHWYAGTDDITNSPEVKGYTNGQNDESFPMYWVREVPFVI